MRATAAVSSPHLTALIEALPEYDTYGSRRAAEALESPYRLAIASILKECGDLLLDAAEEQQRLLTPMQSQTLDALLNAITQVLHLLNCNGEIHLDPADGSRRAALNSADGRILAHLEEVAQLAGKVRRGDVATFWLPRSARRLYRVLRRLCRETERRNRLLGLDLCDPHEADLFIPPSA